MDIKPPKKRRVTPASPQPTVAPVGNGGQGAQPAKVVMPPQAPDLPLDEDHASGMSLQKGSGAKKHKLRYIIISIVAVLLLAVAGSIGWYVWATGPRSADQTRQEFSIQSGETLSTIASHLESKQLIRSALAFELYAKLHNSGNVLQAGSYKLAPKQSVADIIADFKKGQDSVYNLLIPPGLTLKQLADPSVKGSFADQGFSADEIKQAFAASYTSPLLKERPAGASLEGYIFPETFQVRTGDSLQSVLERAFNELYAKIEQDGLTAKFTEHGLTLYQALTLASIVQKETSSAASQPQVAQVFLSRLQAGMTLGSDVTFIYAAHQLGVTPTPELDSPYNTRIHTGLPPGPIANMNYSALQAVANPAPGDYLFFVAGDDGVIHFSQTNAEHEQQVQQYCQKLCSQPLQ